MAKFEPAIKWSGSKRSQSELIVSEFPKKIKTYYEPFCGGCSVLMQLMLNEDIEAEKYICSDINNDIISLWNEIKNNPNKVCFEYKKMWEEMNFSEDRGFKRDYFNMVRDRFNKYKSPYDFMFIMRTTTNGMPRYNKKGEFNNSFHITRNGINPQRLEKIIHMWSNLLLKNNVIFLNQSYEEIKVDQGDVLYLDPPYANTKGMYYGSLNIEDFFYWLKHIKVRAYLSFNGISGDVDNTYNIPKELYNEHKYLISGNSSFKRTIGNSNDNIVYESLYLINKNQAS